MQKIILFINFIILGFCGVSQTVPMDEIRHKTDSILREGNLLYRLEKAAWISTDQAMEVPSVRNSFGGFLTYLRQDTVVAIIYDRMDFTKVIFELLFTDPANEPVAKSLSKRTVTEYEKELILARDNIINGIIDNEYDVREPEGFSLNFVILPFEQGYKLYILTGTSQHNIIPFGNDYIFFANAEGEITRWRKFHSRLIPQSTVGPGGEPITTMMHSHLRSEPYISATDICTFMLYGGYYGLNEFGVYSPALGVSFTYFLDQNKVEINPF